jgi:hypothetical protein
MNDSGSPKLERRWYQFSLRTLLILVTMFSLYLGVILWAVRLIGELRYAEAALASAVLLICVITHRLAWIAWRSQ